VRVQDLQRALWREIDSEPRLRQSSKQDFTLNTKNKISHLSKGHLSGGAFKYGRLGEGQIRLLILWPSKMDCYPLICTLRTEKLKEGSEPKYAALSYFWGTDSPEALLYLLRQEPTQDLLDQDNWGYTAKHSMRISIRLRRRDVPVALWVDALCIDQANKRERTEQLRKMVDIYHKAENVCIWLGEADSDGRSDDAMKFIRTIMDFAMLDTYMKDNGQAKKWYALSELMRDRWFSRRWVVQEIALAKSETVHCGAMSVQWPEFVDAVSILVSNQTRIKSLFDFKEWREGPETLREVQSFGANILIEATSRLFLRTGNGAIVEPVKNLESLVT
jgi:heterokaryon incompatibility protein (HET)